MKGKPRVEVVRATDSEIVVKLADYIIVATRSRDMVSVVAGSVGDHSPIAALQAYVGPVEAYWAAGWLCMEIPKIAMMLGRREPLLEVNIDSICQLLERTAMEKWAGVPRDCITLRSHCDSGNEAACIDYFSKCALKEEG